MKKTYLLIAVFLLLIGVRTMAMLQQARNWLNQRFSSQAVAAARVATTSGAKDNQQKRLFSYNQFYNTNEAQQTVQKEQHSAFKETVGAVSAYIITFFWPVLPLTVLNYDIEKEKKSMLNKRSNKNLGPLHKPADYNDQK